MSDALVRVLRLARPLRARLGLSVLLGACAIGAGVGLMATSGYLISKAALHPPILSLAVAIAAVRFFGVSRGVFRYLERLVSHDAALRLLARVRVAFFERLEPLVPDGLPAGARVGDLLSRFVSDVDALQHVFVRALGPPLVALLVGAGAVTVAALALPSAGLVLALAFAAGAALVPLLAARLVRRSGRREAPARAALASEVVGLVEAAPELVVYDREGAALAGLERTDAELARVRRRSALAEGAAEGLVTLLTGAALVVTLLVAVPAVHGGRLDGVLLGMLALLALAAFEAVRPLPGAAQHLGSVATSAERLFEVIDRPAPVGDPEQPLPAPAGESLRLEGVRARYGDDRRWVLDGVDLELRRGRAVALVGPSGAGKTTLAHCLVRFRDPDEGRVVIDDRDLREYRQEDVRGAVVLVSQDAHLFATTIRENVKLARPDATDEEIEGALRRARIWDWVETLPEGLDTFVGDRGEQVSGGQRQRLALARAYLTGAGFLVFDEPTAHLDAQTAAGVVEDVLAATGEGRGVLLITHSPLGVDRCDEVLSLDSGRLVRTS